MLIRSQNKAVLLNFSNLDAIYAVKDGDDFIISSLEGENKCTLGKYSTKEKAMKVLDMIQEAYANVELIPMAVQNIGKMFQKAIGKAIMNKMIFQMPEEGSV